MATRYEGVISRFYDYVDGVVEGDPADMLSEDLQFEMVYPAGGGAPEERISGGKAEYREFRKKLYSRPEGPPARATATERRHHIKTIQMIDGVEYMLGEAQGGRRQGTILAAAQADKDGKMSRYVVVMTSVKFDTQA